MHAEVNALTAQADAIGIDTYAILDDIARTYADATQDQYNAAARDALAAAIARSNQDGSGAAAQTAPAAEPAQDTGLTAPARADIEAQQEARDKAEREEAARQRAADNAASQDEDRKRIAQASVRAAAEFELGQDPLDSLTGQQGMFDEAPQATASTPDAPAPQPITRADVTAAQQQAATIQTKETDKGVAMFSRAPAEVEQDIESATAQAVTQWQEGLRSAANNPQAKEPSMATPAVLRMLGAKAAKLVLPKTYLRAIMDKHGDVPASVFENLPALLADPLFIIPHKDGGLRVFVEAQTAKGEPIAVGVSVDAGGRIQTVTPFNDDGDKGAGMRRRAYQVVQAANRGVRIYARNNEALERARASAEASPGLIPLQRGSISRASVITRADVVKRVTQSSKPGDPRFSVSASNATPADSNARNVATQLLVDGLKRVVESITKSVGQVAAGSTTWLGADRGRAPAHRAQVLRGVTLNFVGTFDGTFQIKQSETQYPCGLQSNM